MVQRRLWQRYDSSVRIRPGPPLRRKVSINWSMPRTYNPRVPWSCTGCEFEPRTFRQTFDNFAQSNFLCSPPSSAYPHPCVCLLSLPSLVVCPWERPERLFLWLGTRLRWLYTRFRAAGRRGEPRRHPFQDKPRQRHSSLFGGLFNCSPLLFADPNMNPR